MKRKRHNLEISYDDTGSSQSALLFIHGFPLDRTLWSVQTPALADVAHVVAPDLRGLGESPLPGGAVTMDTYADDMHDLLDALEIPRDFRWVGTSRSRSIPDTPRACAH